MSCRLPDGLTTRALPVGALFVCVALLLFSPLAPAETARVAKVLDGDSLRLADGREVRLIGINAPDYGRDGAHDEPFTREAQSALARLIGGGEIRLEYDAERKDRYQRTLAHAFLPDGRSVQQALLREGLAFHIVVAPNLGQLDRYRAAETEARRARRGVWSDTYYLPRAADRLSAQDSGFRFIEGRVERIGRGDRAIYLNLAKHVALVIPTEHWHRFGGDPKRLLGRRVTARGWLTWRNDHAQMRLTHPAMLETAD
jgi:micrococcal nuclease